MIEDWKGEHLIRAQRFEPNMTREHYDAQVAERIEARIVVLRQAFRDGLSLTQAAQRTGIPLSTAHKLNARYGIGFPAKSWTTRRKGLIA